MVAAGIAPKVAANWVTGEAPAAEPARRRGPAGRSGRAASGGPGRVIGEAEAGRVSAANAKAVLATVFASGESPRVVIEQGLAGLSDVGAIGAEIEAVLAEHPDQVVEYRAGKTQVLQFLVGRVMKRTAGRADAHVVNDELRRRLDAGEGG